MPKFSVKDLLIATTLVAVGLTLSLSAFNSRWYQVQDSALLSVPVLLLLPGAGLVVAGGYYPFHKRFSWGIFIGMMVFAIGFAVLFFILLALGIH